MRKSQIFEISCLCLRPPDRDYLSFNWWPSSASTSEKLIIFNKVSQNLLSFRRLTKEKEKRSEDQAYRFRSLLRPSKRKKKNKRKSGGGEYEGVGWGRGRGFGIHLLQFIFFHLEYFHIKTGQISQLSPLERSSSTVLLAPPLTWPSFLLCPIFYNEPMGETFQPIRY